MGLLKLNLDTLGAVDFGRVNGAFEAALERAVKDCADRPLDERARKITLTLDLVPIARTEGSTVDCDGANGKFKIKCSVPDHETGVVNFGVQHNGQLIFSPTSPADHRQQTLFEEEETES